MQNTLKNDMETHMAKKSTKIADIFLKKEPAEASVTAVRTTGITWVQAKDKLYVYTSAGVESRSLVRILIAIAP